MNKSGKKEEHQPSDSAEKTPKDKLVVKKDEDKQYKKKTPNLPDPEKKRKYSEQPPTKQNTRS